MDCVCDCEGERPDCLVKFEPKNHNSDLERLDGLFAIMLQL